MANLAKVLKQLGKTWSETDAAEMGQRVVIPDGNYKAILDQARIELSKASERLQIAWPFKISGGKQDGKKGIKFDGLDNEVSISYAKGLMNALGIDIPDDPEELPDVLKKFFDKKYKDRLVNITVKTDGEYTNIYINGYADDADDTDAGKSADDDDKDDKKDTKKKTSDSDTKLTKKDIRKMSRKELKALIKDRSLDVDVKDFDDDDDLQDAVIDEMKL